MVTVAARVFDCFIYRLTRSGDPEFLLLLRSPHKMYANTWRMVGGKIEDGETAWQAAQREVLEETGLMPEDWWAVPAINAFYEWEKDRINLIPVFAARVKGDEIIRLDAEHTRYQWVSEQPAMDLLKFPGQREGLRTLASMIRNPDGFDQGLKIKQKRNDQ